jgi:hypothetical protein
MSLTINVTWMPRRWTTSFKGFECWCGRSYGPGRKVELTPSLVWGRLMIVCNFTRYEA